MITVEFNICIWGKNAQCIVFTDIGEDVLKMCQKNIEINTSFVGPEAKVKVKELNWNNTGVSIGLLYFLHSCMPFMFSWLHASTI